MKIRGHPPGAWFNHGRFNQRKAKGYRLSRRFDHLLSRLLSRLLFKLLPPRWYLRTQGVKLYCEPRATVIITYRVLGEVKTAQVRLAGGGWAAIKMLPLWFRYGFVEPVSENGGRWIIPAHHILKVEWYDPVLKDYISIDNLDWRLNGNDGDG